MDLAAFYCFAVGWPPAFRGKTGGRNRGGGAVTEHERRRQAWGRGSAARGAARAGPAAAWVQGAEPECGKETKRSNGDVTALGSTWSFENP